MTELTEETPTLLVVSAHAADFVWRAGGAIALHASRGWRVHVVCLSFGERGESASLWREPGATLESVKARRRDEATAAAKTLGAETTFLDGGDYPLRESEALIDALIREYRELQPALVLTHTLVDPYNLDHPEAARMALRARMVAQADGCLEPGKPIGAPQVLFFEPHQPEQCDFTPNALLDITEVFDCKRQAMECMDAQQHLRDYYADLARRRGVQAVRNSGLRGIDYAEAFQRVFPTVSRDRLS